MKGGITEPLPNRSVLNGEMKELAKSQWIETHSWNLADQKAKDVRDIR